MRAAGILLLASVLLTAASAQEPSAGRQLKVTADEIAFDAKAGKVTATGGVKLTGEGLLLTCGQLEAAVDQEKGELAAIEATQNVQFQMEYRQQEQTWRVNAVSQLARFLPAEQVLTAEGGAVVEVDGGESGQHYRLTGDIVQFELQTRRLVARKQESQPQMEITLPPASPQER